MVALLRSCSYIRVSPGTGPPGAVPEALSRGVCGCVCGCGTPPTVFCGWWPKTFQSDYCASNELSLFTSVASLTPYTLGQDSIFCPLINIKLWFYTRKFKLGIGQVFMKKSDFWTKNWLWPQCAIRLCLYLMKIVLDPRYWNPRGEGIGPLRKLDPRDPGCEFDRRCKDNQTIIFNYGTYFGQCYKITQMSQNSIFYGC